MSLLTAAEVVCFLLSKERRPADPLDFTDDWRESSPCSWGTHESAEHGLCTNESNHTIQIYHPRFEPTEAGVCGREPDLSPSECAGLPRKSGLLKSGLATVLPVEKKVSSGSSSLIGSNPHCSPLESESTGSVLIGVSLKHGHGALIY